jgi:hypothetical protein
MCACGCGDGRFGSVEGRVTVAGKQVTAGRVVFRNDTTTLDGPIDASGRYRLTHRGSERLPVGDYGVILLPPELRTPTDSTKPPAIDTAVYAVPFRDTATSGVQRRIEPGPTTIDVDFVGAGKPGRTP